MSEIKNVIGLLFREELFSIARRRGVTFPALKDGADVTFVIDYDSGVADLYADGVFLFTVQEGLTTEPPLSGQWRVAVQRAMCDQIGVKTTVEETHE